MGGRERETVQKIIIITDKPDGNKKPYIKRWKTI